MNDLDLTLDCPAWNKQEFINMLNILIVDTEPTSDVYIPSQRIPRERKEKFILQLVKIWEFCNEQK